MFSVKITNISTFFIYLLPKKKSLKFFLEIHRTIKKMWGNDEIQTG